MSDIYRSYIEVTGVNLYGTKKIELPMPQYIVFYNGEKHAPDCEVIHLSDMFSVPERSNVCTQILTPCLECSVTILNINYGHNKVLLERCKKLNEYAQFVSKIRSYLKTGRTLKESVDCTVKDCIKSNVLKEFLQKNRSEVESVILTEYNEELHLKSVREEGIEEGVSIGISQGISQGISTGISTGILYLLSNLGEIPEPLEACILEEKDLETLRKWIQNAARAENLKEFQDNM